MNPLSPFTYYRRHKRQSLLLVGVVALVTLGVHMMVSVTDSLVEYAYYSYHYLTRLSQVSAEGELDPEVVARIRAHPDVAHVIPENGAYIGAPGVGIPVPFPVLGVAEADLPVVIQACDLRLKEGRLIEPRTGEIVLSEELAHALDLRIGDQVGRAIDEIYYEAFVTKLTVVGILESVPSDAGQKVRAGFVSYEYLASHELYGPRPSNLLVIPSASLRAGSHESRKAAVDDFLETLVAHAGGSPHVHVKTYAGETESLASPQARQIRYGFYGFLDCLLAGTATLTVVAINQISITRRLPELGLLHALGYRKRRLICRSVLQVAAVAGSGWGVGLALSLLLLAWLNNSLYAAQGWPLNPASLAPLPFTVPIPLAVVAFTGLGINRIFNRLDAVTIVERGKLGTEEGGKRQEAKRSSSQPLSSRTFYQRHRRRGLMSFIAIVLMVLGVAFPAFFIATQNDANVPFLFSYLRHASIVSPVQVYGAVDHETVAQIRAHPAVAHVVPAKLLSLTVNGGWGEIGMPIYAVREGDLRTLMDVYEVHLSDGRLPHPRSNEIVLSSAVALNRGVGVGDKVGQPVYEQDGIPTEMVVVGILEPDRSLRLHSGQAQSRSEQAKQPFGFTSLDWARDRQDRPFSYASQCIGFVPYEYVEGHERYAAAPTHFLVAPVAGREAELEVWLEENADSPQIAVDTFNTATQFAQDVERDLFLFLGVGEAIVAVAAAVALAVLNYIFFVQRREEFGVLHAVGHSRIWLVGRALRESVGVVSAAWVIGAAFCVTGLLYVQANVYAPKGLSINLYNPWPWLFTLPIPLAVVAASAGTIGWMLSRLDPVSIIERR